MTAIVARIEGDGIARIRHAIGILASPRKMVGLARALNHTGQKVHTEVRRRIAQRTSAPVRAITQYGALKTVRATAGALEFQIRSTGKGIPLKVFAAEQGPKGVRVTAWGKRYLIPHAFMVASMGGHVFWRTSRSRLPIRKPTGPSIPKELVKQYVEQAMNQIVSRDLPPRLEHEIRVMTEGIVS